MPSQKLAGETVPCTCNASTHAPSLTVHVLLHLRLIAVCMHQERTLALRVPSSS